MPDATVLLPSPAEPRRAVRRWPRRALAIPAMAALATGVVAVPAYVANSQPAGAPTASLALRSDPAGAAVLVDGRDRARTPARIDLAVGNHRLTVRHPDAMEENLSVHAAAGTTLRLDVTLWRRAPRLDQVRPPFPGSAISAVSFLDDGRLALDVALPPGDDHQLWLRDRAGRLEQIGPPSVPGPIVAAADARRVAYLAPAQPAAATGRSGAAARLLSAWIATADGHVRARCYDLPADAADASLGALSWSPDGAHLLLISIRQNAGAPRTQLLWLDPVRGTVRTLVELPAEVIPGSLQWNPRGDALALLTRAGAVTALCLLGVAPPSFRYLGDLGQSGAAPLPFPPLAWSPDGSRAVYAAPVASPAQTLGELLFGAASPQALFVAALSGVPSRRLGGVLGSDPVWRPDGRLLALVRPDGKGTPELAAVDPISGATRLLGGHPLPAGAAPALSWDAAHGQALLAQRRQDGGVGYSLLTFTSEAGQ